MEQEIIKLKEYNKNMEQEIIKINENNINMVQEIIKLKEDNIKLLQQNNELKSKIVELKKSFNNYSPEKYALEVSGNLEVNGDILVNGDIICSGEIKSLTIPDKTTINSNNSGIITSTSSALSSDYNNTNIITSTGLTISSDLNISSDYYYPNYNSGILGLSTNGNVIYKGGFSGYNQIQPIKKIISNKLCNKPECRISLESINNNDYYYECSNCQNCFKEDIMDLWLQENNICPMCRKNWSSNYLYINQ